MIKYYYYFYVCRNGYGRGVCSTERPEFPLSEVTNGLSEGNNISAVITSWQEISRDEFEKMSEIIK